MCLEEHQAMDPKCWCVELNDGYFIPVLGFGTYAPEEVPKSKTGENTKVATNVDFHHVDSAHLYENEEEIGKSLRKKMVDSTLKREDIFYTTKPGEELVAKDASGEIILDTVDFRNTWEFLKHSMSNERAKLHQKLTIHFPHSQPLDKCKGGMSPFNQSKLLEFCKSKDIVVVAYDHEILNVFDFELTPKDMKVVDSLSRNFQYEKLLSQ
ncbi:hypothetical protein HPG69_014148, partial [Diceros bicornis minor]